MIFKTKMADDRCSNKSVIDILSSGQNRYGVDADGVHIVSTLQMQLHHPCPAAMQPYVKLL